MGAGSEPTSDEGQDKGQAEQAQAQEARTELIPAVETASTRELPEVHEPIARTPLVRTDDPAGQRFEPSPMPSAPPASAPPASAPPASAPLPTAPPPAAPGAAAPAPAPVSLPSPEPTALVPPPAQTTGPAQPLARAAAPPQGPPPPSSSPGGARTVSVRSVLIAVVSVVLVAIIGLAIGKTLGGSDDSASGKSSSRSSAAKTVDAQISSFDPSGGSGFRQSGTAWGTQTYSSATFGNLKKGVGLVLDLGARTGLGEVSFTADGASVELRAADSRDQLGDGYVKVGSTTTADGATSLSGDGGGKHRYWMIWVSKLGQNGGYSAKIDDIKVKAS